MAPFRSFLVSDAPVDVGRALLAAADAPARRAALLEGHAAGGNARLLLHLELAFKAAAPLCAGKAAAAAGHLPDLVDGL